MIITELYNGQGLGNQLACYVTTRVVAEDMGVPFGIMTPEKFKGFSFMDLDFGEAVYGGIGPEGGPPHTLPRGIEHYFKERWNIHPNGANITIDDPLLNEIKDNTKIDGIFQSEDRIIHRKDQIKEWLRVKPEKDCYEFSNPDTCIINFRGGEYSFVKDFFLPPSYWDNAIKEMRGLNPNFKFVVITDDVSTASRFFPKFPVHHFDIGVDYSIIKNAHYLIVSNSSFPYYATLTSDTLKYIIAPKYWGRYNISDGYWACGYNIYRSHTYLDRNGKASSYQDCLREFNDFVKMNKGLYE